MINKISYFALCLAFFLVFSCVSKNKYVELENRMNETQAQLEEDKILFESGSVKVKPKGQEVLLKLADSFRDREDQKIAVEGHTDNVQIGSALLDRFPTNWELSAARATAVVRFLQEKGNIAPERLTASGFSFYRPVATNETPEDRKQNRRIEIILVPER
jgi:chemotaxis protein MotB